MTSASARPLWGQTPVLGQAPLGLSPGSPKESRLLGLLELHFQQAPVYLGRLCWVSTGPVCHGQCGQCGHSSQEGIYSFSTLQIRLYDQLYWNPTKPLAKIPKISVHLCIITSLPTLKIMWKIHPTKIFRLTINDINFHLTQCVVFFLNT